MKTQKVVRTFSNGWNINTSRLEEVLKDGYYVVFVTPFIKNGSTDYVEYIVQKDED